MLSFLQFTVSTTRIHLRLTPATPCNEQCGWEAKLALCLHSTGSTTRLRDIINKVWMTPVITFLGDIRDPHEAKHLSIYIYDASRNAKIVLLSNYVPAKPLFRLHSRPCYVGQICGSAIGCRERVFRSTSSILPSNGRMTLAHNTRSYYSK